MDKFTISARINDNILIAQATSDGTKEGTVFEGYEAYIERIRKGLDERREVYLISAERGGTPVTVGYDSPLALAAMMFVTCPQSLISWSVPKEVLDFLVKEQPDAAYAYTYPSHWVANDVPVKENRKSKKSKKLRKLQGKS